MIPLLESLEWNNYFKERYIQISKGNNHLVYQIYQDFYKKIITEKPSDEVLGNLFCVHAVIFSIEKLLETTQQHSYSAHMLVHRLKELIEVTSEINSTISDTTEEHTALLQKLKNKITMLLSSDEEHFNLLYSLYQVVWSHHLNKDFIVDEYILKVQAWVDKGVRGDLLHYELAHLHFLKQNDAETIRQMEKVEEFDLRVLFSWAIECADLELWDRLSNWLECIQGYITHEIDHRKGFSIQPIIHSYLEIFQQYAEHIGDDVYERSLEQLLPYSFYPYCHHLLRQKQFRKWTEIHIALDRNPFRDNNSIAYLEKYGQEALLPIYHFYIEIEIEEKNRESYKNAVAHLKRLRALYVENDQSSEWNRYLRLLMKQYARLRAFQEELRKGNITQ